MKASPRCTATSTCGRSSPSVDRSHSPSKAKSPRLATKSHHQDQQEPTVASAACSTKSSPRRSATSSGTKHPRHHRERRPSGAGARQPYYSRRPRRPSVNVFCRHWSLRFVLKAIITIQPLLARNSGAAACVHRALVETQTQCVLDDDTSAPSRHYLSTSRLLHVTIERGCPSV